MLFDGYISLVNKERELGADHSSQFPVGECVEFYITAFLRHHEWHVPRGPRVVWRCLRAWSGRHEVTRTAIWETQYSVPTGSVLFSHSGDSVTNWQDPESVQLGGSKLCIYRRETTFNIFLLNCNKLLGSCRSVVSGQIFRYSRNMILCYTGCHHGNHIIGHWTTIKCTSVQFISS